MSTELVGLAVLMFAVTYPSRALPLLAPGIERLPPIVLAYLRLVGPAVLAALAAANVMIVADAAGRPTFHVGIEIAGRAGHYRPGRLAAEPPARARLIDRARGGGPGGWPGLAPAG